MGQSMGQSMGRSMDARRAGRADKKTPRIVWDNPGDFYADSMAGAA